MSRSNAKPARGLQQRLMLAFAVYALGLMALFTLYALAFAYTVEDAYLVEGLKQEEARQRAHFLQHGDWLRAEDPNTLLAPDPTHFPAELRAAFQRDPQRREFAAEPDSAVGGQSGATLLLPLIERVIIEQSSLHSHRHLDLAVEVPADTKVALAENVVQILLANLIGNAFAHGDRDGRLADADIQIELRQSRLWISNRARVPLPGEAFEAFRKGARSTGFGLGLAIVRRLCDRHRIDLRIEHHEGVTTASFPVG